MDSTDPQQLTDDAVYQHIREQQANGKMPLNLGTNKPLPLNGWSMDAFNHLLNTIPHDPSAGAPGAPDPNAPWRDQLKSFIRTEEGSRATAYDDKIGGVKTVGIGFNLDRTDGRDTVKSVLGMDDAGFDDLHSGKGQLSSAQQEALLDHDVQSLDGWLTKETKGYPFRDHQRIALLDLAYNRGPGALKGSGILDAAMRGDNETAATLIRTGGSQRGGLKRRREFNALQFLGADAHSAMQPTK